MWKGIEVWGNSEEVQNHLYQGWVKVIGGGTIENSLMGIFTNRMDDQSEWIAGYTGGMITASDAYFINNKIALQFFSYGFSSLSSVIDCVFETNDFYPGSTNPVYFISVSGMLQLRISNCDFLNETSVQYAQRGIYSNNSILWVEGRCTEGGDPCTAWDNGLFHNLQYGVYAIANNPNRYVSIDHVDFDLNFRGLVYQRYDRSKGDLQ